MDAERTLTVALVGFVAGSITLMITLTIVGILTDGRDVLRWGLGLGVATTVALGTSWFVHRRASDAQLTGRDPEHADRDA